MRALIIIDMQKLSFSPETPRYKTDEVINKINKLSDSFRRSGEIVIFIQHDGSRHNFCKPGSEEWEILDELKRLPEDIVISKTVNDSFYQSDLDKTLKEKGIKDIVITGCATDFCVDSTVKIALNKDYNITVVADAHTTADRSGITADKVVDYYNWIWADMFPTEGKIKVIPTEDLIL